MDCPSDMFLGLHRPSHGVYSPDCTRTSYCSRFANHFQVSRPAHHLDLFWTRLRTVNRISVRPVLYCPLRLSHSFSSIGKLSYDICFSSNRRLSEIPLERFSTIGANLMKSRRVHLGALHNPARVGIVKYLSAEGIWIVRRFLAVGKMEPTLIFSRISCPKKVISVFAQLHL